MGTLQAELKTARIPLRCSFERSGIAKRKQRSRSALRRGFSQATRPARRRTGAPISGEQALPAYLFRQLPARRRSPISALDTFPDPDKIDWLRHRGVDQHQKLAFDQAEFLPSPLRDILFFLNSRPMLQFLEKLTGIPDIFGDPYYNGGGLHQTKSGGSLEVHADYSYHPKLKVDRRINVLVYLNKDWKEEYGGHFELWNRELTRAEVKFCRFSTAARSSPPPATPTMGSPGR